MRKKILLYVFVIAVLILFDQASKALIVSNLDLREKLEIIPAFFTLFLFPGHKELILRNLKIHFDRMLKEDFLCNVGFDV